MTSHPAAVLLALLCVLLLLVSWRLLTAAPGSKLPPALSSPWTSVPCLLLLAVTSAKLHAASSQMDEVRQQLEQAEWRIKQGWVASWVTIRVLQFCHRYWNEYTIFGGGALSTLDFVS